MDRMNMHGHNMHNMNMGGNMNMGDNTNMGGNTNMGYMDMDKMNMHDHNGHGHTMDMAGMNMGMAGMDMSNMKMHMSYLSSKTTGDFLFEGVYITSVTGIAIAMVSIIALTLAFEGINFWLHVTGSHRAEKRFIKKSKSSRLRTLTVGAVWKMFTTSLGYIIMLAVMTFNCWLLIAAVLASGIGYLLMRPLITSIYRPRASDVTEGNETEALKKETKESTAHDDESEDTVQQELLSSGESS